MTRPPGHRVRTYPGGQCPVVRSRYRHQAKLAQQAEFVEAPPALYDAAIADAPDVDPGEADGTARSGHAENLALLRTARREVLDDQVALADEDVHVALPVGECGAEHRPGLAHSFPVGRHADRRVMVDEILGEEFVDGTEVTLGEQGVDERGDGVLVLADSVHGRSLPPGDERRYPNNLGFSGLAAQPRGRASCPPCGATRGSFA